VPDTAGRRGAVRAGRASDTNGGVSESGASDTERRRGGTSDTAGRLRAGAGRGARVSDTAGGRRVRSARLTPLASAGAECASGTAWGGCGAHV
jgi:hypothetical protein